MLKAQISEMREHIKRNLGHNFDNGSQSSPQPKPTGEWTVEEMGDHAFDLKCGDKILWTFSTEPPAIAIADAHNAALAAEQDKRADWNVVIEDLEKQLAAEREKVQPLVDAGNKMRRTMYSNDSEEAKAWDAALAKIGGK